MRRTRHYYAMVILGCLLTCGFGCDPQMQEGVLPLPESGEGQPPDQGVPDGSGQGGEMPLPAEGPVEQEKTDPTGVWRFESGPFLSGPYINSVPAYMVFNADGSGRLTMVHPETGIVSCSNLFHTRIDGVALFVSFIYDGYSENLEGASFLLYDLPDDNTLEIVTSSGQPSIFRREAEIPAEFNCRPVSAVQEVANFGVAPYYDSGLAFDGAVLWFGNRDAYMVQPVTPDGGMLSTALPANMSHAVHAIQNGDFWMAQGQQLQRRTTADAFVDDVRMFTDLGVDFHADAAAFIPGESVLWAFGENEDDREMQFVKIDAEAEPDVLLEKVRFDTYIEALSWDGTHMWALTGDLVSTIARIDMSTFKAVATYEIPSRYNWRGIAAVGSRIFLIGEQRNDYGGVFMEISVQD